MALQQQYAQPILDETDLIRERLRVHEDEDHSDKVYALRRIAANDLEIDYWGSIRRTGNDDSRYPDFDVRTAELARHNPIGINTQIQAKSLAFSQPDMRWNNIPGMIGEVRKAYYENHFKKHGVGDAYVWFLMDSLISGTGNIGVFVQGGDVVTEYLDTLNVIWDTAFKEPSKKRFVFVKKTLPASEALKYYPKIAQTLGEMTPKNMERSVTVICYWSQTTTCVLHKDTVLVHEPNQYGRIPVVMMTFMREPSVKHPTGSVEKQLGTNSMMLRLQRAWREVALRMSQGVGLAKGDINEKDLDRVRKGQEAVILRATNKDADFGWTQPGEISKTLIELYQLLQQQQNAESGVSDFQRGQTDTQVDFASQLALIAQQQGVQGRYAAQQFEKGVMAHINLLMDIAARFQGPIGLYVGGVYQEFGPMQPINSALGSDGELTMKPGGTEYKAPAMKLQEATVLAQSLAFAAQLPPGLAERYVELVLTAGEVMDKDGWIADMQQAMLEQKQMEMMAMQMQAEQQAQKGGSTQTQAA